MTLIRRAILALALSAGIAPAFAQAPPPVPSLPDAPRIAQYTIASSNCNCAVGFALYGDGTDVDNWIQVFIGTQPVLSTDPTFGWSLSTPVGPLGIIPRPITTAVLKFNSLQSGNITIVGARRPRRISQFQENRGVPARDLNQAITDEIAMLREDWDFNKRTVAGQPGETLNLLPPVASRANNFLLFDNLGNPTVTAVAPPPYSIFADSYGAHHDFVNDDAPAINNALAAASSAGGGWVLLNPAQPYWAQTQITVPKNVTLGCSAPPEKQPGQGANQTSLGCAIYLAPNKPITNNGSVINARIYQDNLHFAGNPATSHALKTIVNNYVNTGTGIINNAPDAIIQDVAIAGFNLDIDENSLNRGSLRHVLLEGQNCIKYETIGDYLKGLDIECWPFYSTNRGAISFYSATISNVADNGSGSWRVTLSSAPAEALVTGDEVYIGGTGVITVPQGALGKHSITVIDTTHFDLTGSHDAPVVTGNSTNGSNYVTSLSTLADLWVGETFTGSCFTGTRTIKKLVPGLSALVADAAATSTATGCSLTFASQAFSATGTPQVTFDALGGQHGVGIEFAGGFGVIANNVFVWAHDTALKFDTSVGGHSITQFSADNFCGEYRSDRTGITFASGTNYNFVSGMNATCGGIFVLNQSGQPDVVDNVVSPGRVAGWVWGSAENDTGSLTLSGMYDPDSVSVAGQGDGDPFNVNGQNLKIVNGSRFPNATYRSDTGGQLGLTIDAGSFVGTQKIIYPGVLALGNNGGTAGQITLNGSTSGTATVSASATGSLNLTANGGFVIGGTAPTCSSTGSGTGATCALAGGSSNSIGTVLITAGTTPSATGTFTVNFGTAMSGTNFPICSFNYDDTGTAWNAGALAPHLTAYSSTAISGNWNNNAVSLTAASVYRIVYECFGK